eukprot:462395-Lingulodinium_polyedra.AAC.1
MTHRSAVLHPKFYIRYDTREFAFVLNGDASRGAGPVLPDCDCPREERARPAPAIAAACA